MDDKIAKSIEQGITSIKQSLEQLCSVETVRTTIELVRELYSDVERRDLATQYRALQDAEARAHAAFIAAGESRIDSSLSWEERVEKYGEAIAHEHLAQTNVARERQNECRSQVSDFERIHPHLVHILRLAAKRL
jgi:hypothetical protein